MRLLFFSSDRSEAEQVWSALLGAGIQCEIRGASTAKGNHSKEGGSELWIEKDKDYHKASLLCAQLGGVLQPACEPARTRVRGTRLTNFMATTADILGSHRNGKVPARWSKHYQRLCAERDRLLARDGYAPTSAPAKLDDLTDAASDESQRCLSLLEASATQATIIEVGEAIRRIERGTYGCCELTGEPIEAERLRAIPWTRFSLAGQTEMEKYGWVRKHALPSLELLSEPAEADAEESETEEPSKNGNASIHHSE